MRYKEESVVAGESILPLLLWNEVISSLSSSFFLFYFSNLFLFTLTEGLFHWFADIFYFQGWGLGFWRCSWGLRDINKSLMSYSIFNSFQHFSSILNEGFCSISSLAPLGSLHREFRMRPIEAFCSEASPSFLLQVSSQFDSASFSSIKDVKSCKGSGCLWT